MKEMIPTVRVELVKTGYIIELYEFLTTGETRKLQKSLFATGVSLKEEEKTDGVDSQKARVFLDMQDEALGFLVKALYKSNDQMQEAVSLPENIVDWVGNLPNEDGNAIYDRVSDIINTSMMSATAKKN
jgi:hypothetical protein